MTHHEPSTLIAKFMGPTWGQQDPGGPHVGHMNLAIWEGYVYGKREYLGT